MKRLLLCLSILFGWFTATGQTYTFTNAGATGHQGPTQTEVDAAYASTPLASNVTVNGGIQEWVVPISGMYIIEASGAQGGGAGGGHGATLEGEFTLTAGDTIQILVGQIGESYSSDMNMSGGGGSFVVNKNTGNILLIAGGGGAAQSSYSTTDAVATQDAQDGEVGTGTVQGLGGTAGNGGGGAGCRGGGGGGFLTDGAVGGCGGSAGNGGLAFINGGLGGDITSTGALGGFGGGGSSEGTNSAWTYCGGGGGYSGGGGASDGSLTARSGGGSSYNSGSNPNSIVGVHTGHGQVSITVLSSGANNDAGVISIDTPSTYCPGTHNVVATIQNFGVNVINSVTVNWSVDGVVQTPVSFTGTLDTMGGTGSISAQVTMGSFTFTNNPHDIDAWTSMPNGVVDTFTTNDTASDTFQSGLPAPGGLAASNITATSADLSWNSVGGAGNYTVIYGPAGFNPASGGSTQSATGTSVNVGGLSPVTDYDVYIYADCGGGTGISDTAGPVTFSTPCSSVLSGTYTIGGPGGGNNFSTFGSAVIALNTCGVSGPVVFNVASGTYNEQVAIGDVPGVSATNTVTFQPDPGNTSPVEVVYSATGTSDNYVWAFTDGAEYITVKGLTLTAGGSTYARVIDFTGSGNNIAIEDNILNGYTNASTTSNNVAVVMNNTTSSNRLDSTTIKGNQISGGSYGLYWYGVGSTDMEVGNRIDSNVIDSFYYAGIWSYYQDEISVIGNTVTSKGAYSTEYGVRHYYNDNLQSIGNKVVIKGSSTNYGFYIYYCDATSASPGLVANNMVSALDNSGTTYGMYIGYGTYLDIVHNTVFVNAGSATGGHGLYFTGSASYNDVRSLNNNIVNTGGGVAMEATSGATSMISAMDYNNYFSTGNDLANWGGTTVGTLDALQSASSRDSNSISGDPIFVANDDLHAQGNVTSNNALPFPAVTTDIDGDPRSATTPDMGADEYTPLPCLPPLIDSMVVSTGAPLQVEIWFSADTDVDSVRVEWGPEGFTPATGSMVYATGTSVVIDHYQGLPLPQKSCYDVYFEPYCGGTPGLLTGGPVTFCTPCGMETLPYYETFDGSDWISGTGTTDRGEIDECWERDPAGSSGSAFAWYVDDNTTTTAGTGPDGDKSGSGNYLYTESTYGSTSDIATFSTPVLDLSSVSDPALSFWYHMYGQTIDYLAVDVWRNGNWDLDVHVILGEQQTANSDPWLEQVVSLQNYAGDTVQIRFRTAKGGTTSDVAIDEVSLIDASTVCLSPTALAVDSVTDSSAYVSWDSFGGRNATIQWGPVGFVPGTGAVAWGQTSPYTITGLSAVTEYDVYVMDSCDGLWVGPVTFRTACENLLNGSYTIGGTVGPSNFATIDSAVTALINCGVSGPVVFNLASGTYNEQVSIGEIYGVSATNTITFRADPGNTSPVEVTYSASGTGDNYIWAFNDGAEYITVKGLTLTATGSSYARVIDFTGSGNNITIEDNILNGLINASTTSTNVAVIMNNTTATNRLDSTSIVGNEINGGSYAMYWYGVGTTDMEVGNRIDSNVIDGFYYAGIWSYYQDGISVTGNTVTSQGIYTTEYGIRHYYNDNVQSVGNKIVVSGSSTNYGYYIYYNDATSASPSLIANNMVSALDNSGTTYGMYIGNSTYLDVVHNTVLVNAGSTTAGHGIYFTGSTSYNDVRSINNSIVNTGGGVAMEVTSGGTSTISAMDYNNYYATGTDLANWGGTTVGNLSALQTASSRDANSVSGDPVFVANDDLHVLGSITNDVGTPFAGVTTDIDGDPRSATAPDIGADEYAPASGDIYLMSGDFIKGLCLSTNDTIVLDIQNLIGPTVNFSVHPLTIHYGVTGPVNTTGTIVVNTGTLNPQDTLSVFEGGIDLSIPGTYTLTAYLDSNTVNGLALNDTLDPTVDLEVKEEFSVSPQTATIIDANDSVKVCVESSFFSGGSDFFISEVCHYKYTVGAPVGGWPAYIVADDYIEITGVPGSDLGGITLEQWDGSSMMSSHTFPPNTLLSPNGTAIIAVGQMGSSTPSPADFYYHGNGSYTGSFGSGGNNGRILKDASGTIIDAVGVGTSYSFPASSGVTASDWSGNSGNHTTTSGVRLTGPDLNNASNWVVSNVEPQDPNVVNNNVPVPSPQASAGLTWTLNGVVVDSTTCIYVGPLTTPGTYTYIASYSNACGSFTDSVVVTVPTCLPPFNLSANTVTGSSATLVWDTVAGNANNNFQVSYGIGISSPNDAGAIMAPATTNSVSVTGLSATSGYCYYVREICTPGDTSIWAGPYCFQTPCATAVAPYTEDFESHTIGHYDGEEGCWDFTSNNPGTTPSGGFSWEVRNTTQTTSTNTGPDGDNTLYPATGGKWIHSDNSGGSPNDSTMFLSPIVDISSLTYPELEYHFHNFASPTSNYRQPLYVDLYDGVTWYYKVHEIDSVYQSSGTAPWKDTTISLGPYSATGMIQVRFRSQITRSAGGAGDVAIDDVSIYNGSPWCVPPTNLSATNVECTSAALVWNAPSVAQSSIVEYGIAGFTPGTGTVVSGATSPLSLTGLTPGTNYQFYVASVCSPNDTSAFAGPINFATSTGPLPTMNITSTQLSVDSVKAIYELNANSSNADSIHWAFGGGNTANGEVVTDTFVVNGTVTVTVTAFNDCGDSTYTFQFDVENISLSEAALAGSLNVFPNPSTGVFNLAFELPVREEVYLQVINTLGQVVSDEYLGDINSFNGTVDLTNLPKGVYILKVRAGNSTVNRRLSLTR